VQPPNWTPRAAAEEKEKEYEFKADVVLVTASLGVLKHGSIGFEPALPAWKQGAIDSLGFGILNKLVVEFPYSFWGDDDSFGCINAKLEDKGRFYMFWNLERAMDKPILVGLIAGASSYEYEQEDAAASLADCLTYLRKIFGETEVPEPVNSHCTRWANDQFARGSYSFVANGSSGDTYDQLKAPLGKKVHFAGEATNRFNPATVPGAYISGLLAAGRIDDLDKVWLDPFRHHRPPVATAQEETSRVRTAESDAKWSELIEKSPQAFLAEWNMKRKRGMRSMYATNQYSRKHDEAKIVEERRKKDLQLKKLQRVQLERMTRDLLAGNLAPVVEVKKTTTATGISSHIQAASQKDMVDFTAKAPNLGDLPSIAGFGNLSDDDVDMGDVKQSAEERERQKNRKRKKKQEQAKKKKRDSKKASQKKHSKKHEHTDKKRRVDDTDKKRKGQIAKMVRSIMSSAKPDGLVKDDYKKIVKKTTEKVFADWSAKNRADTKLNEWFDDARKQRITKLLTGYCTKYMAHREK
jgi:hypothetical protein